MLLGKGFGFWNTMPIRLRRATGSVFGTEMSSPSKRISPSMWKLGIRSFMRLKQRNRVLLPQPEGPISAVICCRGISIVMFLRAIEVPYQADSPSVWSTGGSGGFGRDADSKAGAGTDGTESCENVMTV